MIERGEEKGRETEGGRERVFVGVRGNVSTTPHTYIYIHICVCARVCAVKVIYMNVRYIR